jgi:glutathione S-transferase
MSAIDFYQITGSTSFAVRCALEEIGAPYRAIDVTPFERDDPPSFGELNPWRQVPALRLGEAEVYETGACLLYLAERFPEAALAPPVGDLTRGAYLRWVVWLSDSFRPLWERVMAPRFFTTSADTHGVHERGLEELGRIGDVLEAELTGRTWCLGERYSVADIYLYMLVGWQAYVPDLRIGGAAIQSHYDRVGARPAIARTRELDDLDERLLRHHPGLRGGKPVAAPVVDFR